MKISINDICTLGEIYYRDNILLEKAYLYDPHVRELIDEIANRIGRHNAVSYCHPVDSFIQVLYDIYDIPSEDIYINENIIDKDLPGYMVTSICVFLPILVSYLENGYDYYDALDALYNAGAFDWFAYEGRHLASESTKDVQEFLFTQFAI